MRCKTCANYQHNNCMARLKRIPSDTPGLLDSRRYNIDPERCPYYMKKSNLTKQTVLSACILVGLVVIALLSWLGG